MIEKTEIGIGPLDAAFNAARGEIYATWRGESREVTGGLAVLDGRDFSILQRLDLPAHPNRLELSADGQVLWRTVRVPYSDKHPA